MVDGNEDGAQPAEPVEIPRDALDADILRNIIEHFVLREGTDYGTHEYTLEQKVAHVMQQIDRGDAKITFDPDTESVTLVRVR